MLRHLFDTDHLTLYLPGLPQVHISGTLAKGRVK
jgi:hypothetical protein